MFRVGVDIGGTFTDFAIWRKEEDDYGQIGSRKEPTSRPNVADAVKHGIAAIAAEYGIGRNDNVLVIHGTTISTNAVIERSQGPIALLVTKGFRDILEIARLKIENSSNIYASRPEPLVPRQRVFEIPERILVDGTIDTALDEEETRAAIAAAVNSGAKAIGVCLLHAYANPVHERKILEIAREFSSDIQIVASHEVWPQPSEYERAMLTLLNVYVKELMDKYIGEIEDYLKSEFPKARLYVTKSNGGIMSSEEARRLPIHTLLSGPSAGVTAARTVGDYLDIDRILTFDMGGTSTDVSLIERGRPMTTGQATVGVFPLYMPVTAVEAMGAGGGSVVWLDSGILKVGPRSAGSSPGPACYNLGGTEPTLSDAYLIANYISTTTLLGDRIELDRSLAEMAFAPIAEGLGVDIVTAAESAINVATSNMLAGITPYLAHHGVSASDLTLMIFGGAGGIHGPFVADEISMQRIIVPRMPSVFCAFGALVSDLVHDAVYSISARGMDIAAIKRTYSELCQEGRNWLNAQSDAEQIERISHILTADMRYKAQSFEIAVDVSDVLKTAYGMDDLLEDFHKEHLRLFDYNNPSDPVSIVRLRVRTIGTQRKPMPAPGEVAGGHLPGPIERRSLRLRGRWVDDVPVYSWLALPAGLPVTGPAVITQNLASTIVPEQFVARMGRYGDLEILKEIQ